MKADVSVIGSQPITAYCQQWKEFQLGVANCSPSCDAQWLLDLEFEAYKVTAVWGCSRMGDSQRHFMSLADWTNWIFSRIAWSVRDIPTCLNLQYWLMLDIIFNCRGAFSIQIRPQNLNYIVLTHAHQRLRHGLILPDILKRDEIF